MKQATSDAARSKRISELRSIALAEISVGGTDIDAQDYYNELQGLLVRPLSTEFLEAGVMLAVIAQIRPAKAISSLQKLRARYEKLDALDRFNEFERRIRDYLAPLTLTNHGYHDHSFAEADHTAIWRVVDRHLRTLRRAGYEVFLNSGTLLGVVRDARLIDHDDDVDLAVMLNATTLDEAAAEWRNLRNVLIDLDIFENTVEGMPGIYKLRPAGDVEIDLFPAWVEGDRAYVYPHTRGLPAEDVLPLQPCALTGQAIPAVPERMLAENYGPDWQNPDPFFKFPWASANKRFAPFLERIS